MRTRLYTHKEDTWQSLLRQQQVSFRRISAGHQA